MLLNVNLLHATDFADKSEVDQKIQEIDREIKYLERFIVEGENAEAYKRYQIELIDERQNYQNLSTNFSKKLKRDTKISPQILEKNLPKVQANALKDLKKYKDETLPIEKRYELILSELSATKSMLSLVRSDTGEGKENFLKKLEKKEIELEELKLNYELRIIKNEQNDLAEMKKTGVRVGAMFDFYYQWDFNKPSKGRDEQDIQFKNYNTKHNDFTIQLAEINFLKTYKNLDLYMDVDFGEMAEQNKSHSDDPISHHLGQTFLRYRFNEFENTTLTAGKFYTHFGLEVPKSIENRNYSRPFYFTMICPFWHEGLALTKTGMGQFSSGVYVYDRTDDRVENNSGKTYGFQLSYSENKINGIYNFISGAEKNSLGEGKEGNTKTMHEIILTYNASETVTLVVDALVGRNKNFDASTGKDQSWAGIVAYFDFKTSLKNTICLRGESFSDLTSKDSNTNLFSTDSNPVDPTSVTGYTLTNRYNMMNGSEIRLEYRLDSASEKIFPKNDDQFSKKQNTLTVAWLYSI